MNRDEAQPGFPLAATAGRLTLTAALVGAAVIAAAAATQAGRAAMLGAGLGVMAVWLVAVAGLGFTAAVGRSGPAAMAAAHYLGAAGRVLLCVALGVGLALEPRLSLRAVLLGMAAAYLPLLMVESVCVARFVRGRHPRATPR